MSEFIRNSWFVQEQQITASQRADTFYCVVHSFLKENLTMPFVPEERTTSAYFYANWHQVNGDPHPQRGYDYDVKVDHPGFSPQRPLCLREASEEANPSRKKMRIESCWKPNVIAQPYWILDVGVEPQFRAPARDKAGGREAGGSIGGGLAGEAGEEGEMQEGEGEEDALEAAGEGSEDHAAAAVRSPLHGKSELMYEWVIIIGGQPTVKLDDGCTVKEDHTDASGLWLMTRQPQPPSRVIEEMHASLAYHGVSRAQLHPVEHAGCHYVDANLCRDGKCSSYCIKWGCTNGCCKRNAIEDTTVVRNVTHWGVTEGDGFGYEKPPGVQWGPIPVEDCDQCAELCVADDCDEWTCTEDYKRCQFKSQRNASLVRSPKHRRVLATAGYERWSRIE